MIKEKTTLNYYNENAEAFCESTKDANMSLCYKMFEKYLPAEAKLLDLGCGSGRDSKYFICKGFDVTSVDGSEEICKYASNYLEKQVPCLRFQDMAFNSEFDGVWACASLLHVNADKLPEILKRVWKSLKPDGVLYASFKYGTQEREKEGRYFIDLNETKVYEFFERNGMFQILLCDVTVDVREGRSDEKWINVVAQKVCSEDIYASL